jgi:hypothetical protein
MSACCHPGEILCVCTDVVTVRGTDEGRRCAGECMDDIPDLIPVATASGVYYRVTCKNHCCDVWDVEPAHTGHAFQGRGR